MLVIAGLLLQPEIVELPYYQLDMQMVFQEICLVEIVMC